MLTGLIFQNKNYLKSPKKQSNAKKWFKIPKRLQMFQLKNSQAFPEAQKITQ